MQWIEVLVGQDWTTLSWLLGRKSTAKLLASSSRMKAAAESFLPLIEKVVLLHGVTRMKPLGLAQCHVNSAWMFKNLHLTADRPGSQHAKYPLRVACPHCDAEVSYYIWGATRYLHVGYHNSRVISEGYCESEFNRSESSWEPQLEIEADRLDDVGHPHDLQALQNTPVNPRDMSIAATWPGGSMRENQLAERMDNHSIENVNVGDLVVSNRVHIFDTGPLDYPSHWALTPRARSPTLPTEVPSVWRSPSSDRTTIVSDVIRESYASSLASTPSDSTNSNIEALGHTASGIHAHRRHWGTPTPSDHPGLQLATERLNHIAQLEAAEGRDGLTFRQGNRDLTGPLPDFSSDEQAGGPHWVPGWLMSQRARQDSMLGEMMWAATN